MSAGARLGGWVSHRWKGGAGARYTAPEGVCCRPCWGLRTLRACESANETGLYLPSSRLAYPPTSQAPEAPTATPSAQTLEDPTSPATGTDSSDAGHLICLSSTVDGLEWREEIIACCNLDISSNTSRPSRRGSVYSRKRARQPPQSQHASASMLLQSDPPPSPTAACEASCRHDDVACAVERCGRT